MPSSSIKTPTQYLAALDPDRRKTLSALRKMVRAHLPKGYQETFNWGMISYEVPLSRFPKTYNKKPLMYVALAAQKNHLALYLMCAYANGEVEKAIKKGFKAAGKKLDMGKSCIRFKSLDDLPLDTLAQAIASTSVEDFIKIYEKARS